MTALLTTVSLADGQTVEIPDGIADRFRGLDELGHLVIAGWERPEGGEYLVGLTKCCQATAKGCEFGIGCRSCYAECEPSLGGEATLAVAVAS